jgi:hypothetical protein
MRTTQHATLSLFAISALAGLAHGQATLENLVQTGDPVPGAVGTLQGVLCVGPPTNLQIVI